MVTRLRSFAATAVCAAAMSVPAVGQRPEPLGTISFPTSGAAAAQPAFMHGMLLYWSFEYERAAEAFREAQKADPSFALAYWGEALTHTHQVWNEQNVDAARIALLKFGRTPEARAARIRNERERAYFALAEALYGEGAKARRDTLFEAAAAQLERAYPAEDEPKLLRAVGLLGLNQGTRDFTTYMQAGAIAEDVLRRNPDHPGAAHFVIHAFDDPTHAPLGLWAARLYSKIAPGAPHAQHMTTHIFFAMGMWDDAIAQNIVAAGSDATAYRAGHYTWWLGYGYLQAGRYADARRHMQTVRANYKPPQRRGEGPALQMMRAHYVIDTERWTDSVAMWDLSQMMNSPYGTPTDRFVEGFVALRRGDRAKADLIAQELAKAPGPATGATIEAGGGAAILAAELRAAIFARDGRTDDAVPLLRRAARLEEGIPFEFGPPMIPKPSRELLGEILLAAGRPDEAKREFQQVLSRAPGRARALIGLIRAARAARDETTAAAATQILKANWHAADPDVADIEAAVRPVTVRAGR
jgi:tetratricopeptide (TPR) repeat protein